MNAILVPRQLTLTKPSIYEGSTCTWMSKSNELLNISQTIPEKSLLAKGADQIIDEFGFLIRCVDVTRYKLRVFNGGRGQYNCKGFCRLIPKRDSRKVSWAKTKDYYCVTCEIAMKCVRCRCCHRIGRREPRSRNRITRAILNGTKYIE